ncbi:TPA: helix-turn-helix domain-containing protein [Clostridioides difficile]
MRRNARSSSICNGTKERQLNYILFYHSESGKITMQVDEELKGEIYTDMMKAILKFEIKVK